MQQQQSLVQAPVCSTHPKSVVWPDHGAAAGKPCIAVSTSQMIAAAEMPVLEVKDRRENWHFLQASSEPGW